MEHSAKGAAHTVIDKADDGLFNDIRNYLQVIQAQMSLQRYSDARQSLERMLSEMNRWEDRLKRGEQWERYPESILF
jgi:hypothetical protein